MCKSNTCKKSHFVRKIHLAPNSSFCATYFSGIELRIAPKGRKDHRRGYNPRWWEHHTRKPWKGERWSFVPSALLLFGPCLTGAYTPACILRSLSGLCLGQSEFFLIRGDSNIFKNFPRIFSIQEDDSHEVVMDGRGATTESSLSDGASLQSISAVIRQHHLHGSIFHLHKKIINE